MPQNVANAALIPNLLKTQNMGNVGASVVTKCICGPGTTPMTPLATPGSHNGFAHASSKYITDFCGVNHKTQRDKTTAVDKSTVTLDFSGNRVRRRVATVSSASRVGRAPTKLHKMVGIGDAICNTN